MPKQSRLKRDAGKIFQRSEEIVPPEKGGSMVRAFNLLAGISDDLEIAVRARGSSAAETQGTVIEPRYR